MISRRLLATLFAGIALAVGTAGVAAAQTTTPPTSAPAAGACTSGVTFTLLKKTKPGHIQITADRANVRRGPGTDCVIYASLKKGKKLKTTGRRAKAGKFTWVETFTPQLGLTWVATTLVKSVK